MSGEKIHALRVTRRGFMQSAAAISAAALTQPLRGLAPVAGSGRVNIGVVGCGGRGTGAAADALKASSFTRITALADVMPDRLQACRTALAGLEDMADRATIADHQCFTGFEAASRLLETDVDMVILATPPHFRPAQLEAAVKRGCHVFIEKPVAVDPEGVRSVLASAELAERRGLSIVAGTQRRHETCYHELMRRIHDGQIGRIIGARVTWNQGGLWMHPRQPHWSDMEWQLRNWLYFTWLSGDHIVEQHVHNLDVANWALGAAPIRATGMGGRQVRTSPAFGNVYDHFAIEYEYPDGMMVQSMCRQIDGCAGCVEEVIIGTEGVAVSSSGRAEIRGSKPWLFDSQNNNPYVTEHAALAASITGGKRLNEGRQIAHSTLTAIMGRMSAYTGRSVAWEQALNSKLDLAPRAYDFGPLAVEPVAMPGRTPLV